MQDQSKKTTLYTAFGETRRVRYVPSNYDDDGEPDVFLWVERRGEGEYAAMSPQLRDKRVAFIYREDWINAETTDD